MYFFDTFLVLYAIYKHLIILLAFKRAEWPSGPASSISLTYVKHGCVRSETGWATFQMNNQNSSLSRPSEGTLNKGSHAWMRHA